MTETFSGKISAWVRERNERETAVFRESAQRLIEVMQTPVSQGGRMRVDTGFLRASLMVSLGDANFSIRQAPPDPRKPGDTSVIYQPSDAAVVIAQAEIADKITATYTAAYARAREYRGDAFRAMAVMQWPQIVSEVCREAQSRAGG